MNNQDMNPGERRGAYLSRIFDAAHEWIQETQDAHRFEDVNVANLCALIAEFALAQQGETAS
jgi:hypothetical protein